MLINEKMDIGLATVYRVLTNSNRQVCLNAISSSRARQFSEINHGKHHDHLVCIDYGRVEEFYDPEIEKRQNAIAKERGFAIQDHALYLYAQCTKAECPHRAPPGQQVLIH